MHLLFVHQNFPAQFGHIAAYLVKHKGFRCTFVSERPPGREGGIERIQYKIQGGARKENHYCSRTFENAIWHTHAVYEALKGRRDIKPDLIVGHSGFGSTLFLRELYDCPIINYFEYFYRPRGSDMDFRPDFPSQEMDKIRARARNAMLLLDLENCDRGYSPTRWQRDRLPKEFHEKVRVIFDGVDTSVWNPGDGGDKPHRSSGDETALNDERRGLSPPAERPLRKIGSRAYAEDVKIVTYATRGMESMRGFDIFMKLAKRLCDQRNDVIFLIAGQDRVCYGGDDKVTGKASFKEWVLAQDKYDLARFEFLGLLPPPELAQLFRITDLHVYLTVPFVLSWSLMNALACGSIILASNTAPVQEVIRHEQNGLLCDFFDIDGMVKIANQVLDAPQEYKHLGAAGVKMIQERYSLDVCLPRMLELYEEVLRR
jgi:glycosyltransferase involved in cell wall biosynthesis